MTDVHAIRNAAEQVIKVPALWSHITLIIASKKPLIKPGTWGSLWQGCKMPVRMTFRYTNRVHRLLSS